MDRPRGRPAILDGERRRYFGGLVLIGLAQTALAIALMLTVKWMFDALAHQTLAGERMLAAVGVLLGLTLAAPAVQFAQARLAELMGQSYVEALRARLFSHLLALSPRAVQARHRGGLTLRFIGDMGALRRWISLGLARMVITGMTATGVLVVLGLESAWLATALALSLAAGMAGSWWIGRRLQGRTREARRQLSRLAAFVNERMAGMASVHACGQQVRERNRLKRQLARVRQTSVAKMGWAGLTRGAAESGALLAYSAVLLVGALDVMAGRSSVGMVAAAMTTVGVLMPQLRGLGRVPEYWHGFRVSRQKIDDLLAMRGKIRQAAEPLPMSSGEGRVEMVGLSIAGSVQEANASVMAGARVALVGPNGSGKSTLLAAMVRLVAADRGALRIDGQDVCDIRLRDLRRQVGLVSLDLPLLRGTVEYNLTYACRRPDPAWRAQVEQWCGIDAMAAQWKEGRLHRVTEGGANLSAGQRVRIMLARALFNAPSVLLLDEIDSALDEAGLAWLDAMLAVYPGTVIWISHEPRRIAQADQILRLSANGQLEATDPADDVLAKRRIGGLA